MSSRALFFIVTYCLLRSFNVSASDHATEHLATATFSGGCFWCMEQPFDLLPGVIATIPGYTGGDTKNPTYKQVSGGTTGHVEAIQIQYDPAVISYEKLLDVFWRNIDPRMVTVSFAIRAINTDQVFFITMKNKNAWLNNQKFCSKKTKSLPDRS